MQGKLILVVAPSGSGKGALLAHLREMRPDIIFPVSCTTRAVRPGEVEGGTYYYLSEEQFKAKIEGGEFLEWATYGGNLYGTLKSKIVEPLEEGHTVVREVEVQGMRQLQRLIPSENLKTIFIDAGSWEDVERRILDRAPISYEELLKRKEHYDDERSFMPEASAIVENFDGGLEVAKANFLDAIARLEA